MQILPIALQIVILSEISHACTNTHFDRSSSHDPLSLSVTFSTHIVAYMETYIHENVVEPVGDFVKSSIALVNRCNKPDAKGTLGFWFSATSLLL